jgi:hypothetical protein
VDVFAAKNADSRTFNQAAGFSLDRAFAIKRTTQRVNDAA